MEGGLFKGGGQREAFLISQMRPIREGMTVSRDAGVGGRCCVTWFSLGGGTSISPETYDRTAVYVGAEGDAIFEYDGGSAVLRPGGLLVLPGGTLSGARTEGGAIYTEIITGEEKLNMNERIRAGEAFALKEMIGYEEGSIANLDVVNSDSMKFVLMAFDKNTGLQPHRAPGDAIVFALEGRAVIGYEGAEVPIREGECFRFEKDGLHSVTADGRFKMALLLVRE